MQQLMLKTTLLLAVGSCTANWKGTYEYRMYLNRNCDSAGLYSQAYITRIEGSGATKFCESGEYTSGENPAVLSGNKFGYSVTMTCEINGDVLWTMDTGCDEYCNNCQDYGVTVYADPRLALASLESKVLPAPRSSCPFGAAGAFPR